jgi:membrane protein implicated in regulation of membrane protease activity
MPAFPWWAWTIAAGLIGLMELHAPGSYFIWIALGAAVTAAVEAAVGLSFEGEIATFAIACALSCLIGYLVYPRFDRTHKQASSLNRRDLAMIGARGVVCTSFVDGRGKVKLGDSVWQAEAARAANLTEGTPVTVTATRDTWLIVAPSGSM